MAVDEAILRSVVAGDVPLTLRVYSWTAPALSLGYFQKIERSGIDLSYCNDMGIVLVRRPTGGKAVLHGHDVTFSVALREDDLPSDLRSIKLSHEWIMRGVVEGMRLMGLQAELGPADKLREGVASGDCFARVAECDVRFGTQKIAGAAQVRKWGGLLEQGSIPVEPPDVEPARVFGYRNIGHASGSPFPCRTSRTQVQQAIILGFQALFGSTPKQSCLTEYELSVAGELERLKYAAEEWTYRRGIIRIDNSM